jgi:GT2 family glycosyltransferase
MSQPTWIVVVNYNGLADTRKCLRSLGRLHGDWAAVLVDNASAVDPGPELHSEFPWCHFVRNQVNGGWAGGNNTGIRYALERGAEQIVLLNNDTVVAPDLIERLINAAAANPEFGILGPVIRFLDDPHDVMTDGCVFNGAGEPGFFQRKPVALQPADPPAVTDVDIVNGCCMMVAARVFARVGLVDERFFLVHEESDLCLRARRAGFRCGVLGEALVWHKGSVSFRRTGHGLQRYYDARNLLLLLRKHLFTHQRRGPSASRWEYLKYVYYRYAIEKEHGEQAGADAVLEGLADGLAGRYGPRTGRRSAAVPVMRFLFETYRRRRAGLSRSTEGASRASSVC